MPCAAIRRAFTFHFLASAATSLALAKSPASASFIAARISPICHSLFST